MLYVNPTSGLALDVRIARAVSVKNWVVGAGSSGSVQSGSRTCQSRVKRLGGLLVAPRPWGASGAPYIAFSLLTWPAHAVPQWHSMGHRQIGSVPHGEICRSRKSHAAVCTAVRPLSDTVFFFCRPRPPRV